MPPQAMLVLGDFPWQVARVLQPISMPPRASPSVRLKSIRRRKAGVDLANFHIHKLIIRSKFFMRFLLRSLFNPDAVALMKSGYGDLVGACAEFVERLISVMPSQPDDAGVFVWAPGAGRSWLNVDTTCSRSQQRVQSYMRNSNHNLEIVGQFSLDVLSLLVVEAPGPQIQDDTLHSFANWGMEKRTFFATLSSLTESKLCNQLKESFDWSSNDLCPR